MKKLLLLLAVFLVFTVCPQEWQTCAQSDPGKAHFQLMVDNVNKIASELVRIYENDNCGKNKCNCSQDLCGPLPKDINPFCFPSKISGSNLYNCSNLLKEKLGTDPNLCYSIRVTNKSSVTYVRSKGDDPSENQMKTICRTQKLDELFQTISNKTDLYTEYYVGMIDGTRRNFPGREEIEDSCFNFDSRKRPWYSGAISYPNHLVILIDAGHEMERGSVPGTDRTRLNVSIEFGSSLIETVYEGGYVNVFSFGPKDEPFVMPTQVQFNYTDPQSHPELEPLNTKIKSLVANTTNTLPVQFAAALNTAMEAFNKTERAVGLLNVVVITDGSFTDDDSFNDSSFKDVINQVKTLGVRVFIYGMNAGAYDSQLKSLSGDMNGIFQDTVYTKSDWNPLLVMQSYFGYLAKCHETLYGDTPFWSNNYKDYYNVGDIVTVSKPAITKNGTGTLVGVAAIDIIFNELEQDVIQSFTNAVNNQRPSQDAKSKTAGKNNTAPATIPESFMDSPCKHYLQPEDVLCSADAVDSKKGGIDPKCCTRCKGKDKPTSLGIKIGAGVGVPGVVLLCVGIGCFLYKRKKPRLPDDKKPEVHIDPTDRRWTHPL